jgi:hypothetical protein
MIKRKKITHKKEIFFRGKKEKDRLLSFIRMFFWIDIPTNKSEGLHLRFVGLTVLDSRRFCLHPY